MSSTMRFQTTLKHDNIKISYKYITAMFSLNMSSKEMHYLMGFSLCVSS